MKNFFKIFHLFSCGAYSCQADQSLDISVSSFSVLRFCRGMSTGFHCGQRKMERTRLRGFRWEWSHLDEGWIMGWVCQPQTGKQRKNEFCCTSWLRWHILLCVWILRGQIRQALETPIRGDSKFLIILEIISRRHTTDKTKWKKLPRSERCGLFNLCPIVHFMRKQWNSG